MAVGKAAETLAKLGLDLSEPRGNSVIEGVRGHRTNHVITRVWKNRYEPQDTKQVLSLRCDVISCKYAGPIIFIFVQDCGQDLSASCKVSSRVYVVAYMHMLFF